MKYYTFLFFLFTIHSCTTFNINKLVGTYSEEYIWPTNEVIIFHEDSTYSYKVWSGINGQFSKGRFELKHNKIILINDLIITDSLLLVESENYTSDSCLITIEIIDLNWDASVYFYSSNDLVAQIPIAKDTVSILLPRLNDSITVKVGLLREGELLHEPLPINKILIENYSECLFEYYPSNSWFEFNTMENEEFILKRYSGTIRLKHDTNRCYKK